MRSIVNSTLVWRDGKPYEAGTKFAVVDEPKADKKPVQVDPTTAEAWERNGWIEAKSATEKPHAG